MILLFHKLKSDDKSLTEKFIKEINETINRDIKDTNGYRKVAVMIKGSEHIPPRPEQVNSLMTYFTYNYNNDENEDIFYKIAYYHIEFELLKNKDIEVLASWLKSLSDEESKRIEELNQIN